MKKSNIISLFSIILLITIMLSFPINAAWDHTFIVGDNFDDNSLNTSIWTSFGSDCVESANKLNCNAENRRNSIIDLQSKWGFNTSLPYNVTFEIVNFPATGLNCVQLKDYSAGNLTDASNGYGCIGKSGDKDQHGVFANAASDQLWIPNVANTSNYGLTNTYVTLLYDGSNYLVYLDGVLQQNNSGTLVTKMDYFNVGDWYTHASYGELDIDNLKIQQIEQAAPAPPAEGPYNWTNPDLENGETVFCDTFDDGVINSTVWVNVGCTEEHGLLKCNEGVNRTYSHVLQELNVNTSRPFNVIVKYVNYTDTSGVSCVQLRDRNMSSTGAAPSDPNVCAGKAGDKNIFGVMAHEVDETVYFLPDETTQINVTVPLISNLTVNLTYTNNSDYIIYWQGEKQINKTIYPTDINKMEWFNIGNTATYKDTAPTYLDYVCFEQLAGNITIPATNTTNTTATNTTSTTVDLTGVEEKLFFIWLIALYILLTILGIYCFKTKSFQSGFIIFLILFGFDLLFATIINDEFSNLTGSYFDKMKAVFRAIIIFFPFIKLIAIILLRTNRNI